MANETARLELSEIRAVVTDIEGTTTPIDFVRDTLFPYARPRLGSWLRQHAASAEVRQIISQIDRETARAHTLEQAIAQLEAWSDADRKILPLKVLQGLIWAAGYADGSLVAPIYADVLPALQRWQQAGLTLAVYSSGSVPAQQLLFGHTDRGDLRGWFSHWFDTTSGGKLETASYRQIAAALALPPSAVLFLSDHAGEVAAAHGAGWQALLLARPDSPPPVAARPGQQVLSSFAQIELVSAVV
ncbi:acireductone synthase [Silvimonas sp. JCM 19000]